MNDTPDDFANHPQSITEAKGKRSLNAADWTPRDALINALRDLDAGLIKPSALIVCVDESQENRSTYYASSPNLILSIGLLDYVKMRFMELRRI